MELTAAQAGERLGISERRVQVLAKQGRLAFTRRLRGVYLFDEVAVTSFAALPRVRTGRPRKTKAT